MVDDNEPVVSFCLAFAIHRFTCEMQTQEYENNSISCVCACVCVCICVEVAHTCRGGSRGRVQGVRPPPPPEMTCGFLTQLEFPEKTRHQSATTFLSGAPLPPKKNAGSAPDVYFLAFALMFGFAFASYVRAGRIKSL